MADWREKIKTISSTNGSSASEGAKRAGMGCLAFFVLAVSILTLILSIGLFISGNWLMASAVFVFFALSAGTAAVLMLPQKPDSL
ncbi:hypothetical protein [Planococcus sp. YIM B11945]|uniref:hypothetical protein n=1 Tax=Planococcus sp. YIM B11945 TaxID=3435410 RepID=UPI003D7CB9E6